MARLRELKGNVEVHQPVHEGSLPPGGFGDIYLIGRGEGGEADTEASEFVVKMEPHNNGPLFTEMHVMYR